MSRTTLPARIRMGLRRAGAPLLAAVGLFALASTALEAAPWSAQRRSYDIETFDAAAHPGIAFGNYSAISNNARLVEAFDEDFSPLGLIEGRKKHETFVVGESYSWYRGINDKRTTVGYSQSSGDFSFSAWMRDRDGDVRTFSDPAGSVYLYRVNNRDVAVGEIVYADFFRPVIVDANGLSVVDVPGVPSDHPAYFAGINDAGAIVGGTFDPDTWEHTCLLWDRCGVTEISHEGASFVAPRAINNRGQVAGFWIEAEIDPLIGERAHGFIREPNGRFRSVDPDFAFEDEIDLGDPEPAKLIDQTTKILDMNDKGEIVVECTGWYLGQYEFDGETYDYVLPVWTYAVGTPEACGRGR